jgi:hypothetical protein
MSSSENGLDGSKETTETSVIIANPRGRAISNKFETQDLSKIQLE